MSTIDSSKPKKLHPGLSILVLFCLFLIFLTLGQIIAWAVLSRVYHYPLDAIKDFTIHPANYAQARIALLLNHAIGTILFSFILSAFVWQRMTERLRFSHFFHATKQNTNTLIGLAIALTVVSTPLNSVFISLNKNMRLPKAFEQLELKMKALEANTEQMIKFLTDFQNPTEIAMALLVMGALTGIGEEMFFRGALQRKLFEWVKNPHVAIWVASAFFSFVHFQFYGFVPRMLLAALFGYMYYWSGNLWVPIVAHACNNSLMVLAVYYSKNSQTAQQLVESEEAMPIPAVIVSALLTVFLLYIFKKKSDEAVLNEPLG